MYHWLLEQLDGAGYRHYEISNAGKTGRECRHNLKYWNLDDYLGLGAAAHSFVSGHRFSNGADVREYAESWENGKPAVDWHQENSWYDSVTDYTFTALRRVRGVGKRDFAEKFGREFWDVFAERKSEFEAYKAAGDAAEDGDNLWITRRGMDIASEIIALFV